VERESHDVIDHAKTKTGTGRRIPLTKPALRIISACKAFPHESDWIFSEYERPLPSRVVEEYFAKYCKILETPQKSTHCARKTYISSLIDAGININTVREAAGHADERTTFHNYVFDRSTPKEKRDKFESAMVFTNDITSVSCIM
jgi:integrase